MDAKTILDHIRASFDGVDILETPNCVYVYYDPHKDVPHDKRQPFATIMSGDVSDPASDLARRGLFRVNLGVERETYRTMFGPEPKWGEAPTYVVETGHDFTALDTWMPHPMYAPMSWVCIVAPGEASWPRMRELLAEAHAKARAQHERTRAPPS